MENANGHNKIGKRRPSTLVFSRQGMPNMDTTSIDGVAHGGYIVHDSEGTPDVIIMGEKGDSRPGTQTAAHSS